MRVQMLRALEHDYYRRCGVVLGTFQNFGYLGIHRSVMIRFVAIIFERNLLPDLVVRYITEPNAHAQLHSSCEYFFDFIRFYDEGRYHLTIPLIFLRWMR